MTHSPHEKRSPVFIKEFLFIFIPATLLVLTLSIGFYFYANRTRREAFRQEEHFIVQQQEKIIHSMMQDVISDLKILVDHYTFHRSQISAEELLEITRTGFYSFSIYKKMYVQIRLLDSDGMERVRIDRTDNHSQVIPADQLQDKSNRYYFRDTLALSKGKIFASPLDLNIEHGIVEKPLNPMLRLGMPIIGPNDTREGVIIINYRGQAITSRMDDLSAVSAGEIMLLNSDGYWLRSDSPEKNWGFMFPARVERTLKNQDKKAWNTINSKETGQFTTRQGLYTFATIFPFTDKITSCNNSSMVEPATHPPLTNRNYYWKLVSFVSRKVLTRYQHPYLAKFIYLNILFVFILGIGSWKAASANCKKFAAEKKLRQLATIDTLTELPNRNLLYDRLSQALARAKRNQTLFAILYLDLDRFKEINDTLGHKAGDKVLQEVALRMKKLLRDEDTVARMGGDEFVVLLHTNNRGEAEGVFDKLAFAIEEPIELDIDTDTLHRQVGVSGGISMYPEDGLDVETLLSKADSAMYRNKSQKCS